MKLIKILIMLTILFASFQICFGQEKLSPTKIYESEMISCVGIQQILYDGLTEIVKDPNSIGYIVVSGKKNDLLGNLRYESWVKGFVKESTFGENLYKFVRGTDGDKFSVQLWKVPKDSDTNFYSETKWDYRFPAFTKPFIFTAYTWGDGGMCPIYSHEKIFAELLIANPDIRGSLVVRDKTNKNFSKTGEKILDKMVSEYKVPRQQLKITYVIDKNYSYPFTDVEFWFVPKIKK